MSKYTTELRFYCEELAGYEKSQDYNKIDEIVNKAAPKIFSNFPIYDESYRLVLETKILKHYYVREIGAETPGLWKLFLNNRLNEIMPYYNQLYKSASLDFNPFHDVDITRDHVGEDAKTRSYDESTKTTSEGMSDSHSKTTSTGSTSAEASSDTTSKNEHRNDHLDEYADTPQGSVQGPTFAEYLTNARQITDQYQDSGTATASSNESSTSDNEHITDSRSDQSNNGSANTDGEEAINSTDKWLEHVYGKQGTQSYSYLLNEYRTTLLNIDLMIINELNDLFMMIY